MILAIVSFNSLVLAQDDLIEKRKGRHRFVKHLMETMSTRDMIGQMIMVDSYANADSNYYKKVLHRIDSNKVGGVCFFKGTSKDLLTLNKIYRQHSDIPLFVAIDGEWGLNMRLTDIETFPVAMSLGSLAREDHYLVYDMASNIARQCKSLGINIDFAPDVDLNINPENPVINMRSFGEDKYRVSLLAEQYFKGLQDNGVMAVIKHFPGHGDTKTDSHKNTPRILHEKNFIDSVDSYPFRYNIKSGVWGVMAGHLRVDALSSDTLAVASINKDILEGYLKDDLEFEGLVFTDAMNMKGLTLLYGNGEAEVRAVEAGVDIMLMPDNVDNAIDAIANAVDSGRIAVKTIKERCKKILNWKYDMGLFETDTSQLGLVSEQMKEEAAYLNTVLAERMITLTDNRDLTLPLSLGQDDTLNLVLIGNANFDTLQHILSDKYPLRVLKVNSKMKSKETDSVLSAIKENELTITAFAGGRFSYSNSKYGIPAVSLSILDKIAQKHADQNIVLVFANPYVLSLIDSAYECKAFVTAYENNSYTQKAVGRLLTENIPAYGTLPVSVKRTHLEKKEEDDELKFYMDNNVNTEVVAKIDSIARKGIAEHAYPGCQILVAKEGKVILNKNYGYLTYDSTDEVTISTLYDIASLSKVMGTTLAVMKLYEEGKIDLDATIAEYVHELKKTKFAKLTVRELLSHYTTLPAVYPFQDKKLKGRDIHKAILKEFKNIKPKTQKYVYSDLNFLLLQYMVENVTEQGLDEYLQEKFYNPMGLENTMYNPLLGGIQAETIAPTESDSVRADGLIRGEVHDPLAYLNGGVCGNAGLFSNVSDLYKICEMLLERGEYDGVRYLKESTIDTFNHRYYENLGIRRALGFDKPFISSVSSHCSQYASQESYGHSGFTGTYLWIEPKNKTILIFLSNRVCPSAHPNKLASMNIRTDINDLVYKLFK